MFGSTAGANYSNNQTVKIQFEKLAFFQLLHELQSPNKMQGNFLKTKKKETTILIYEYNSTFILFGLFFLIVYFFNFHLTSYEYE